MSWAILETTRMWSKGPHSWRKEALMFGMWLLSHVWCGSCRCCSVLQCVAVAFSILQRVIMSCKEPCMYDVALAGVAVCCSMLQCVAVCCSMLQYVAVSWQAPCMYVMWLLPVLQYVAACCRVLQHVAVCTATWTLFKKRVLYVCGVAFAGPPGACHVNESCHTLEWVMSHIWMRHVTHVNESSCTSEYVMSHARISHVTHRNTSCHT